LNKKEKGRSNNKRLVVIFAREEKWCGVATTLSKHPLA